MFIVEKKPKSIGAEAYKTLRTNIQYASVDTENRVIAVTSSLPGEGKTTISGNLAIAIAQGDKKVLIIDCDLRKPTLHKKFKASNSLGVSDLIAGRAKIEDVIQTYKENICIIPSGKIPPNPSEMLASKKMNSLLEEFKKYFDYIILDTPPLQAVTDAQIISTKVDGVILVIKANSTKKDLIKSSIDLIKVVNGNLIGTVLNGTEIPKDKYYSYYGE